MAYWDISKFPGILLCLLSILKGDIKMNTYSGNAIHGVGRMDSYNQSFILNRALLKLCEKRFIVHPGRDNLDFTIPV